MFRCVSDCFLPVRNHLVPKEGLARGEGCGRCFDARFLRREKCKGKKRKNCQVKSFNVSNLAEEQKIQCPAKERNT